MRPLFSSFAVLALVAAFTGCGSGGKRYPVTGKVTVQNKPVAGAIVVLTPAGDPKTMDKKPSGMTKEDGTFSLNTLTDSDGVLAGEYLVTIIWPGKPKPSGKAKGLGGGDDERATTTDQLLGKYSDPQTSGLKATVKAEPTELPPFDLKN